MKSIVSPAESTACRGTPGFRRPAKSLIQDGCITLDPAPNGNVVDRESAFRHHFLQIAVAERITQITPDAKDNDWSWLPQRLLVRTHSLPDADADPAQVGTEFI